MVQTPYEENLVVLLRFGFDKCVKVKEIEIQGHIGLVVFIQEECMEGIV